MGLNIEATLEGMMIHSGVFHNRNPRSGTQNLDRRSAVHSCHSAPKKSQTRTGDKNDVERNLTFRTMNVDLSIHEGLLAACRFSIGGSVEVRSTLGMGATKNVYNSWVKDRPPFHAQLRICVATSCLRWVDSESGKVGGWASILVF